MRWLIEPSGIAIVGASQDFSTINGKILKYLLKHRYQGKIYPVNPKYLEVAGLPCFPSITMLPDIVDLALIAVAAHRVPEVIKECGMKGVKGVIVFSSGFAETGEVGSEIQRQILEIAREYGVRLIGPNCLGVLNVSQNMTATFSGSLEVDAIKSGTVGLVTQSGAVGFMIFNLLQELGVGVNLVVTTGNEADVTVGEALISVVKDDNTRVIVSYIEGLRDGKSFAKAAQNALELGKPFIVLKAGNSESGRSAAATHTAALTGSELVYRGFFAKMGIIEAQDTDELLDLSQVFVAGKYPKGPRVGIITMSGGVGILLADRCEGVGLTVPHLSDELQTKIRSVIPAFGSAQNPIDVTAQSLNQGIEFKKCVNLLIESPEVDMLIVAIAMATGQMSEKIGLDIVACACESEKPLVVAWTVGQVAAPGFQVLREAGVPLYHSPARTANSVAKLYRYSFIRQRSQSLAEGNVNERRQASLKGFFNTQGKVLTERETKTILDLYNLPITREFLVTNPQEAREKAEEIGYPVVLKIDSPDILHKTEAGGVVVNVQNAQEVETLFSEITEKVRVYNPTARINGILIQEQVSPGLDVIIGLQYDRVLGPQILFGLGGIFVEVIKDVIIRPLPLSRDEARMMLEEIKGAALLSGVRGQPALDKEALIDVVIGIAELALEAGEQLVSLDLNPVRVLPKGQGVKILDGVLVYQ